jgi:hypothetical protein
MRPLDLGDWVEPTDPAVSPDGRAVAFVLVSVDLDANQ